MKSKKEKRIILKMFRFLDGTGLTGAVSDHFLHVLYWRYYRNVLRLKERSDAIAIPMIKDFAGDVNREFPIQMPELAIHVNDWEYFEKYVIQGYLEKHRFQRRGLESQYRIQEGQTNQQIYMRVRTVALRLPQSPELPMSIMEDEVDSCDDILREGVQGFVHLSCLFNFYNVVNVSKQDGMFLMPSFSFYVHDGEVKPNQLAYQDNEIDLLYWMTQERKEPEKVLDVNEVKEMKYVFEKDRDVTRTVRGWTILLADEQGRVSLPDCWLQEPVAKRFLKVMTFVLEGKVEINMIRKAFEFCGRTIDVEIEPAEEENMDYWVIREYKHGKDGKAVSEILWKQKKRQVSSLFTRRRIGVGDETGKFEKHAALMVSFAFTRSCCCCCFAPFR